MNRIRALRKTVDDAGDGETESILQPPLDNFCCMDPTFAKFKRALPDMGSDRIENTLHKVFDQDIVYSEAFMPWPEALIPRKVDGYISFPAFDVLTVSAGQKRRLDANPFENNKRQTISNTPPSTSPSTSTSTLSTTSSSSTTTTTPLIAINPAFPQKAIYIDPRFLRHLKKHQTAFAIYGVKSWKQNVDVYLHIPWDWVRMIMDYSDVDLFMELSTGKTLQSIVFITTLLQETNKHNQDIPVYLRGKRILILAPLITLDNWVNEFYQWIPSDLQTIVGPIYNFCDVGLASTSVARKMSILRNWHNVGGILLMNYDRFRTYLTSKKNTDSTNELLATYLLDSPSLVIADEGHRLKNQNALITSILSQIRTPARICLTGYPLQNNLLEYYCMIDFVCPGFLGDKDSFRKEYRKPIENIYADSSNADKLLAKRSLLKIQLLTIDIIHRRDASILQVDLPKKIEYYVYVGLTSTQYLAYDRFLKDVMEFDTDHSPLISLILLRAICNHPSVFRKMVHNRQDNKKGPEARLEEDEHVEPNKRVEARQQSAVDDDEDLVDENEFAAIASWRKDRPLDWTELFFQAIHELDKPELSNKMIITAQIIKYCKDLGEKVLIVSHSLACLDYIQQYLSSLEYNIIRIDGQTPQPDRQPMINRFNQEDNQHVILLSAKAASIGVNIVGASRVILFDLDWNPCYDEQSIGRVYRYGQVKPVYIYRLVTYSTIEQRVMTQSVHKRGISSRVVDNLMVAAQLRADFRDYYKLPDKTAKPLDPKTVNLQDSVMQAVLDNNRAAVIDIKLEEDIVHSGVDHSGPDLHPDVIGKVRTEVVMEKRRYRNQIAMQRDIQGF
ncbi:hypothetical protein EC973_006774 [Apophysomyces ossiformis]|uniref:Uncharacterized protein n=1 Tax=Apophysomyces ossiformis TaxID=679940 RepID=A0A8H7BVV9_9FUNG|nr:hypothetical protein EC973_006774 [Apophysomyces ossiformis]